MSLPTPEDFGFRVDHRVTEQLRRREQRHFRIDKVFDQHGLRYSGGSFTPAQGEAPACWSNDVAFYFDEDTGRRLRGLVLVEARGCIVLLGGADVSRAAARR